ncbi:MAG: VOC family protein [bacterium]
MAGITRIIPLLIYEDIPAAHDFMVKAFGFAPGGVYSDSEGRPVHAEVYAGDLTIWIHRVAADHDLASQRSLESASSGLVVHVHDVDAHYEQVRALGVHIESTPQDMDYGQREYGVRDPEGHRWWFATPLEQSAPV